MTNKTIRLKCAGAGIPLWKLAEKMGLSDSSLSRKLRKELSDDERVEALKLVDELIAEEAEA